MHYLIWPVSGASGLCSLRLLIRFLLITGACFSTIHYLSRCVAQLISLDRNMGVCP